MTGEEWRDDRKLVLSDLEELKDSVKELMVAFQDFKAETFPDFKGQVKSDIAVLKVKSSLFGTIGGLIVTIVLEIIQKLKG